MIFRTRVLLSGALSPNRGSPPAGRYFKSYFFVVRTSSRRASSVSDSFGNNGRKCTPTKDSYFCNCLSISIRFIRESALGSNWWAIVSSNAQNDEIIITLRISFTFKSSSRITDSSIRCSRSRSRNTRYDPITTTTGKR